MDREVSKRLLQYVGYCVVVGIVLFGIEVSHTGISWLNIGWYVCLGSCMMFFGSVSDGVWNAMFVPMARRPFTWYVILTKVPFWFMAGGIGYVVGVVVIKKIGWLSVYEFPIQSFFITGAIVFCPVQFFAHWRAHRALTQQKINHRLSQ
jgi:hypothetical protein